jgi:hypothetical protein
MQTLGLDPLAAPVDMTSGVGSTNIPTHFTNVTIDLQGVVQFPVYAGFTTGMNELGMGLLGQAGFFARFKITFDYRKGVDTIDASCFFIPQWLRGRSSPPSRFGRWQALKVPTSLPT